MTAAETARCPCGCPEPRGRGKYGYQPGHDAKHQEHFIHRAREGDQLAAAELEIRGWEYRFGRRWDE